MRDENYIPPMSNGERKKMIAREHNRAYAVGEPTREVETLEQSTRRIVQGFQGVVDIDRKSAKVKRWGK